MNEVEKKKGGYWNFINRLTFGFVWNESLYTVEEMVLF